MLDRIRGLVRGRSEPGDVPTEKIESLEKRVSHLETMLEGLQDNLHREITRTNVQIEELRKRTEPAEMSRAISEDARHRGL